MVRFFRKKKEQKYNPDKQVHRVFQIGAALVIAYIFYTMYYGGNAADKIECSNKPAITDDEINEKAKMAFQKMSESPAFIKIKDFLTYTESKEDKKNGNILKTGDGVLIYIPDSLLDKPVKDLEIEDETVKFKIDSENKSAPAK